MAVRCHGGVVSAVDSWPLDADYVHSALRRAPHAQESCRSYPAPLQALEQLRDSGVDTCDWTRTVKTLLDTRNAAANASVVLFLASPRSGHSLIGSLIDAHPHAGLAGGKQI